MRGTTHTFRRLQVAMLALGGTVGLGFPSVAYYGFGVTTAETISFHVLCIGTGLLVGTANYLIFYGVVDRQMTQIAKRMGEYTTAYARGELLPPPKVDADGHDALARMQQAFGALANVVTDQFENERIARRVVDALSETVDLTQTCEALLEQLREVCGATLGVVYVRSPAGWERCSTIGVDTRDAPTLLEADSPLALAIIEGPHDHIVGEDMRWLRVPTLMGVLAPTHVHTFPIFFDGEAVALVMCAGQEDTGRHRATLAMMERQAGVHLANARLHHQLSELAAVDELTQLLNRRFGQRRLGEAMSLSARTNDPVGVAMFDIDHFKQFNDTHGHAAGDAVLAAVAGALRASVREYDTVVRWGGEEMLLISPDTAPEAMAGLTERLRENVEKVDLEWQGARLQVTVSAGFAVGSSITPEALVAQADEALYRAKDAGRNRVMSYGQTAPLVSVVPRAATSRT